MPNPSRLVALSTLSLALLAGCVTEGGRSTRASVSDAPGAEFAEPTEQLARQIESHARSDIVVFSREAEWFTEVGEAAYPTLLELAADADARVASFGLATVAAQRDPRLLAPLKRSVSEPEAGPLRLEYARALLALGDFSRAEVLIDALDDEDVRVRGNALKALREATGETQGFQPQAPPEERAAAVVRWRAWWTARQADPHLPRVTGGQ